MQLEAVFREFSTHLRSYPDLHLDSKWRGETVIVIWVFVILCTDVNAVVW